jgi:peptide-methionine (S)-S-oxide reductase
VKMVPFQNRMPFQLLSLLILIMKYITQIVLLVVISFAGCNGQPSEQAFSSTPDNENLKPDSLMNTNQSIDTATFGNGCFWCTEAIFQSLKGVATVTSGYSGGQTEDPDYKSVCTGQTGHAEVIQITFDPSVISFEELLEAFWASHDPTTLNRQGADVGTQYRSVIFYHNEAQRKLASEFKEHLNGKKVFPSPIVTEISPFTKFYKAENYHQQYFNLNGSEPYCTFVIKPKLDKFRKAFHDKLK